MSIVVVGIRRTAHIDVICWDDDYFHALYIRRPEAQFDSVHICDFAGLAVASLVLNNDILKNGSIDFAYHVPAYIFFNEVWNSHLLKLIDEYLILATLWHTAFGSFHDERQKSPSWSERLYSSAAKYFLFYGSPALLVIIDYCRGDIRCLRW